MNWGSIGQSCYCALRSFTSKFVVPRSVPGNFRNRTKYYLIYKRNIVFKNLKRKRNILQLLITVVCKILPLKRLQNSINISEFPFHFIRCITFHLQLNESLLLRKCLFTMLTLTYIHTAITVPPYVHCENALNNFAWQQTKQIQFLITHSTHQRAAFSMAKHKRSPTHTHTQHLAPPQSRSTHQHT